MWNPIRAILVALAGLGLGGCASGSAGQRAEGAYRRLSEEYIDGYLAWRPLQATYLGLHQYDGQVADFRPTSVERERARLARFRDALAAMDTRSLESRLSREARG